MSRPRRTERPGDEAVLSFLLTVTASSYGLPPSDLTRPTRREPIVEARHTAVTIAYTLFNFPCGWLADRMGFRRHCSVMHSRRTVCNLFDSDHQVRTRIIDIALMLGRPVDSLRDTLSANKRVPDVD